MNEILPAGHRIYLFQRLDQRVFEFGFLFPEQFAVNRISHLLERLLMPARFGVLDEDVERVRDIDPFQHDFREYFSSSAILVYVILD